MASLHDVHTCTDLIGPFEMDGIADGKHQAHGLFWTVCRGCGRTARVEAPNVDYADAHESGQLRLGVPGEQRPLLPLPDEQIPTADETHYGFSSKADYDAVQRDKAASPWIQGKDD